MCVFEIYKPKCHIPCFITKNKAKAFNAVEVFNLKSCGDNYLLCKRDKWGFWKYSFDNGCFEIIRGKSLILT